MAPCALGGRVLQEDLAITAITNATHAQITAAYHDYSVGDYVYLTGVAGTLGDFLNNRTWPVYSIVDTDNFTIDADTVGKGAFTTASGGITRTGTPPPSSFCPPSLHQTAWRRWWWWRRWRGFILMAARLYIVGSPIMVLNCLK
jgi:hypothetical protein